MTLDSQGFEAAIVKHCSPTLAGIKPGCLFNVPGVFAADLSEAPAIQLEQCRAAQTLCEKLDRLIARANKKLASTGVIVRAIAHRHCGALIYVWRPTLLAKTLAEPRILARLLEWGYSPLAAHEVNTSITQLGERLESCQNTSNNAAFPHEIGFFLGYPYADVMGFIEHNGQECLCCGCWKVYENQEEAEACFALYKHCTEAYKSMLENGVSISEIAQAGIPIAA